jgi:asparagine synthase (glutamine-hydrolysing)
MSGICGIFNLDAAPVAKAELKAMTAMLEERAPEGTGDWRDGPVGFGHTLLATTAELALERQPFIDATSGCMITADVRLDNRAELLGALQITRPPESVGDAELILAAYLKWGERCPERLLGDFAFGVWDPRNQAIFAARDHFGIRPLYYYYEQAQCLLFASDARAILVNPLVPYCINEGRVAEFLVPELESSDYTSTFFEGIFRLAPGHTMTVTGDRSTVQEYWKPEPGPNLGPMTDEEYAQGFLEVFTKAVESRLRAPTGRVGAMLSGGIDSGAVVAIAGEILGARGLEPLPTYSAVRNSEVACEESRAVLAAVSMPSISPALINSQALDDLHDRLVSKNEEPFDGDFMILKAIYLAAHDQGRNVILDGAGGDVVLSTGSYIVRLIRAGHWQLALQEIVAENKFWNEASISTELFRYVRSAIAPEWIKERLRPQRMRRRADSYVEKSLISEDFAASVQIADRFAKMRELMPGDWKKEYAAERCGVIRPSITAGRERYARLAAAAAVEARDPYLDKRVVDFATRLPGRVRLKNGWPKMILRKLMADKVPDEVRWQRGKPHLGWYFNACVTRQALERGSLSADRLRQDLYGFVDQTALETSWGRFIEGGDAEQIHAAHILSVWLRENANRPVVPR